MLLTIEQRKTLRLILERRYPSIEGLKGFIYDELGKILDEIGTGTLVELRRAVVQAAEAEEWTIELLEALHRVAGPELQGLLDSIGTIEEVREAAFYDDCYVDRYPLVNRTELRAKLRGVTAAGGPRILLVKGNRYSGKSHALIHIRYLAKTFEVPLAEIALREYPAGEEIQPQDFGHAIADALGISLPARLDEKPSRWSVNFLNWLGGQLASRQPLWVVVDDFEPEKRKVTLPSSVDEFLVMLAERVAGALTSTRLFLINYEKELPNVRPHLEREVVPPISDEDLINFFLLFYRDHMPPTDDQTAAYDAVERARRVRMKTPSEPAIQLEKMRDALIDECQELLP